MTAGHVAFIESNTTGTGGLALARLLAGGHEVTFVARQPDKYPFLDRRDGAPGALTVATVETNDPGVLHPWIERLHRRRPLVSALTFSEYYIATVAELAARLGLPGLDPAVARRCRDKSATREALAAAGLPTPWFRLVASLSEACQGAREVGFPCVVKPLAESSSTGVLQVADEAGLLAHFERLHAQKSNARGQPLAGGVLVESLLTGPEYSVETVTLGARRTRVVGVVRKHLSPPPRFVELGHDVPAPLPAGQAAALGEAALAALDAVGYDFGPAHTELRLTPDGPVVVEINPRLAGGMIPELIALATGVDLLGASLGLLRGEPADLEPRRAEHASIRFLVAGRAGRLVAVDGLEPARRVPGVREVALTLPLGRRVKPAEDASDRLGRVIASGPDAARVETAVADALRLLRVRVESEVDPVDRGF